MSKRVRYWLALFLSIALGGQAVAVASLRSCHATIPAHIAHSAISDPGGEWSIHQSHGGDAATADVSVDETHNGYDTLVGVVKHHDDSNSDRLKCAACASCCHFAALPAEFGDSAAAEEANKQSFPQLDLARARNAGSGLERPPRT